MMQMNGQQQMPEPQLPESIRTMAFVAGHLMYFDEVVDVVVTRLEAARCGTQPAELRVDGRKMYISNEMAAHWFHCWEVNPALHVVRGDAADGVNALSPHWGRR